MRNWAFELEEDLRWREAELASFKILVTEADKGSVRQIALLRAMWAMLYAHYEGFAKFGWDLYLEALEAQGPNRGDCTEAVARLSLLKEFKEFRADLTPFSIWKFCNSTFASLLGEKVSFNLHLETESNLWPKLFRYNSQLANLPCTMIDAHDAKIRALVERRNEIAHGQKMVINTLDEYQEYENAATLVMHELAIEIINCLQTRSYLTAPPVLVV